MKKFPRTAAIALVFCILLSGAFSAFAVIEPSSAFYCTDYTQDDVISAATEKYITAMNEQLEELTGAQIVVAAVDFIDGADIEDYTYQVYNEWKIGSAELNNGLLILLVIGEQNYWGVQGVGIRDVLTSGLIAETLNTYLEPYFAEARYDMGVRDVFDAFIQWYSGYYGVTVSVSEEISDAPVNTAPVVPAQEKTADESGQPSRTDQILAAGHILGKIARWFLISIAAGFVLLVLLIVIVRRRRGVRLNGKRRVFRSRRAPQPPPPSANKYNSLYRGISPDGQYSYVKPNNGVTHVRPEYRSGFSGSYHKPPAPPRPSKAKGKTRPQPVNKYDHLFRFNQNPSGARSDFARSVGAKPAQNRSRFSAPRSGGGFTRSGSGFSAPRSAPSHRGGGGAARGGGAGRR